jgi:hypothetical protein
MERRIALQLIAAGFLAPRAEAAPGGLVGLAPAQAAATPYQPKFFTAEEMTALDRLTEILIPADDRSPGASAALVNRFMDVMVGEGSAAAGSAWKSGLAAVDAEASRRFANAFNACNTAQQEQIVAAMAANESAPSTDLERFFAVLKRMTIDGYYTSRIGIHQELQYQGNTVLAEFPGCTHPEHQL